MNTQHELSGLARDGVLRAAINTGNRALVQVEDGALVGVSPALAQRLADEIGATLQPVVYDGAGKVFADAEKDVWDVGFLAIDQTRAQKISFTDPYITIEATFAVRADSDIETVADVDRLGTRVLTSRGSAYDMYLSANLKRASLEHSGTPPQSFAEFREGRCDVVAGVRASLDRLFEGDPEVVILDGVLTSVYQAMVLPGPSNPATPALNDFINRAISDGFVAEHS